MFSHDGECKIHTRVQSTSPTICLADMRPCALCSSLVHKLKREKVQRHRNIMWAKAPENILQHDSMMFQLTAHLVSSLPRLHYPPIRLWWMLFRAVTLKKQFKLLFEHGKIKYSIYMVSPNSKCVYKWDRPCRGEFVKSVKSERTMWTDNHETKQSEK